MTKLSDTQRVILSHASQHGDQLVVPPERLPAAARQTVAKSLIKQGLVSDEHASAYNARDAWQIDGRTRLLRITEDGLRAIGVEVDEAAAGSTDATSDPHVGTQPDDRRGENPTTEPAGGPQSESAVFPVASLGESQAALSAPPPSASAETAEAPQRPPVSQHGGNGRAAVLRMAAAGVVSAWNAPERGGLDVAVAALRQALAAQPARPARDSGTPRQPRTGTKQETVLALLRRDEGATIADIIEATGWQPHTVRGFLAGLKRRGITMEVLERVRQVGPNKQGAKGSYSIYRVAAAPAEAG